MLKLNAGLSRKVGEPDYGSRGASVNVELEVESTLINDPNGLMDRIRRLFALARDAIDAELSQAGNRSAAGGNVAGNGRLNGNGPRSSTPRAATASQLRAIRSIAERLNADPDALAHIAFGIPLGELSLRQASELIDQLKAQTNGNGR